MGLDARRKRVLYRAQHRGFKEADLLIGGFAAARIHSMSLAEVEALERLLEAPDNDLYAWATGEAAPADIEGPVLQKIREFKPFEATLNQRG